MCNPHPFWEPDTPMRHSPSHQQVAHKLGSDLALGSESHSPARHHETDAETRPSILSWIPPAATHTRTDIMPPSCY